MKNTASTYSKTKLNELSHQLKQREAELLFNKTLQEAIMNGMGMPEIFNLAGNGIRNLLNPQVILISTFDHEKSLEVFHYGFKNEITNKIDPRPIDELRQQLIDQGGLILIKENPDEMWTRLPGENPAEVPGTSMAKSVLYVPIVVGKVVQGYLNLQNYERKNAFSECEVKFVEAIANNLSLALEKTRIFNENTSLLAQAEERNINIQKLNKEIQALESRLPAALAELKFAQEQLIRQEKLACLGQVSAGIAHEIKNPLNFVNNFSDLNVELIDEIYEELQKLEENGTLSGIFEILGDLRSNLTKIHQHGKRADGIVKSMLQHSRGGSGKIAPTDLNTLIREFVNLAFHGMRAGKKAMNVSIDLQLDDNLGMVPLISEDFNRVILNLCNNAFDAMWEKLNSHSGSIKYNPKLTVSTLKKDGIVEIQIKDNGVGIPDEYKEKVLQPFFTTKTDTGGTGLGLSITNEIIKAHKGTLHIISEKNNFTSFNISLPNPQ